MRCFLCFLVKVLQQFYLICVCPIRGTILRDFERVSERVGKLSDVDLCLRLCFLKSIAANPIQVLSYWRWVGRTPSETGSWASQDVELCLGLGGSGFRPWTALPQTCSKSCAVPPHGDRLAVARRLEPQDRMLLTPAASGLGGTKVHREININMALTFLPPY